MFILEEFTLNSGVCCYLIEVRSESLNYPCSNYFSRAFGLKSVYVLFIWYIQCCVYIIGNCSDYLWQLE